MSAHAVAIDSSPWSLSDIRVSTGVRFVSTFACGGGSSMGYARAGAKSLGFVDIDKRMANLYRRNIGADGVVADIRQLVKDTSKIPAHWKNADFIDGSPPCTMFSSLRKIKGSSLSDVKKYAEGAATQRLDDLFFWFLEFVKTINPRVFVAENVMGMNSSRSRWYLAEICNIAKSIGYKVRMVQLSAMQCGACQLRKRLLFFGTKGRLVEPPKIQSSRLTLGAALRAAPIKGGFDRIASKKIRANWYHTKPGSRVRAAGFGGIRLDPNDTMAALCASRRGPYHWAEPRNLSYGECSRIQTFPDDYDFGNECGQYVCGMSVPPVMGEYAGRYATMLLNNL